MGRTVALIHACHFAIILSYQASKRVLLMLKLNVLKPAVLALSCFFSSQILAEVQHIYPDQAFLESGVTIIDIRTQGEWMETGFVEGALPLTFFDEQGHYDAARFIHHLDQLVDRDQTIALICRTGNRTRIISEFLATQGFEVINLKGGIYRLMSQGYIPVDYGQRQAEIQASQQCPQIEIC